jgi:hypothetical protein
MFVRPSIIFTITFCLGGALASAEDRVIYFDDLARPVTEIVNPFADLGADQMDELRELLGLRMRMEDGETGLEDRAESLEASLAEQGLDVDWLFAKRIEIMEQRTVAASAVNDEVIGEPVRIPGYLLPLEVKDRKVIEFLLVPTVGACIHTPPPPANQMVHVRYPEGFEIKGYYDPIWIEGVLRAQNSLQDVRYSDGEAQVGVSYAMDAASVRPFEQK